MNSGTDHCILISDPVKDLYEDLDTLFTNFQPGDEKVRQLRIDFATIVEPFNNTIDLEKYTYKLNSSNKGISYKFLNLLGAKIGYILEKKPAKFGGIVVEQEVRNSKDYDLLNRILTRSTFISGLDRIFIIRLTQFSH